MTTAELQDKLNDHLKDAQAMEQSVERMLDVTEHLEIAAYEMLERIAKRAGDDATAEVARRNCADERAMADKIEHNWDKFVEPTLEEEEEEEEEAIVP